ncbi:MAG: hypothetical protein J1D86_07255 [Alistipes sp.]|nr:hypothetical protein [Alistipes sp.]
MIKPDASKKRLVTGIRNLSPELLEELKKKYPLGFTDSMIRIDKPNGEFFYAVPFETADIYYLVKIDVKIDDGTEDDDDKDYYDDELKGADEIQDDGSSAADELADDDDI